MACVTAVACEQNVSPSHRPSKARKELGEAALTVSRWNRGRYRSDQLSVSKTPRVAVFSKVRRLLAEYLILQRSGSCQQTLGISYSPTA